MLIVLFESKSWIYHKKYFCAITSAWGSQKKVRINCTKDNPLWHVKIPDIKWGEKREKKWTRPAVPSQILSQMIREKDLFYMNILINMMWETNQWYFLHD